MAARQRELLHQLGLLRPSSIHCHLDHPVEGLCATAEESLRPAALEQVPR